MLGSIALDANPLAFLNLDPTHESRENLTNLNPSPLILSSPYKFRIDPESIYSKWEAVVQHIPKNKIPITTSIATIISGISSEKLTGLLSTLCTIMDALLPETEDPQKKMTLLDSIYNNIIFLGKSSLEIDKTSFTRTLLHFCYHSFSSISLKSPEAQTIVFAQRTLDQLYESRKYVNQEWDLLSQRTIEALLSSLPLLLQIGITHYELLKETHVAVYTCLIFSRVMDADPKENYSWGMLLRQLCKSVEISSPEKRKQTANTVRNLLFTCIDPPQLIEPALIQSAQAHIEISIAAMAFNFLPMQELECFNEEEWGSFFNKLSESTVLQMMNQLQVEIDKLEKGLENTGNNSPLTSSFAMARIVRYADFRSAESLSRLLNYTIKCHHPSSTPQGDHLLHLRLHLQWVQALSALYKKYPIQTHTQNSEELSKIQAMKIERLSSLRSLIPDIISGIKDDKSYTTHLPYILGMLSLDYETVTVLNRDFQIPSHLPTMLQDKMKGLKTIIEKKLRSFQDHAEIKQ